MNYCRPLALAALTLLTFTTFAQPAASNEAKAANAIAALGGKVEWEGSGIVKIDLSRSKVTDACQIASNFDPLFASNFDPPVNAIFA